MRLDAADQGGVLGGEEGRDGGAEGGRRGGDVFLGAEVAEDIHHADLAGACLLLRRRPVSDPYADKTLSASLEGEEGLSDGGGWRQRLHRWLPDAEIRHLMKLQQAHCHALAAKPWNKNSPER